ncbi:MAG: alpha/beta hydrolase [Streptococcus pyogenes]|nr:MAG: alpha/beta hydrolase [Streptococcus pyogenes]
MITMKERFEDGEFFILSDGTPLYYQQLGQGHPLLMLHGNGGSHHYFRGQIAALAQHFRLILVDCRARGASGNHKHALTFAMMVEDMRELLDFLGIAELSILGFSDGANIALLFAHRYPKRIKKLVLNAPNTRFYGTRFSNQYHAYLKVGLAFCQRWLSESHYQRYLISRLLLANLPLGKKDLQALNRPCLLIVGQKDMIKKSHSQRLAASLPNCQFIEVPAARHTFAKTKPELFNQLLVPFLLDQQT